MQRILLTLRAALPLSGRPSCQGAAGGGEGLAGQAQAHQLCTQNFQADMVSTLAAWKSGRNGSEIEVLNVSSR